MQRRPLLLLTWTLVVCALTLAGAQPASRSAGAVRETYAKREHLIRVRDGVGLHTAVYEPRTCVPGGYPILLHRTPYGVAPYGATRYPSQVGPSPLFQAEGFIFADQDVRGRYLSEGVWEEVRPYVPPDRRRAGDTNEATDAYDTIDWLVRNVPCNNGRVGMWGISYPGFYTSSAMIEAHPALRAVSPQGPVTDYYLGDDSYHNGAFMLAHNFDFYVDFAPRGPVPRLPDPAASSFGYGTSDGYRFYLELGSLADATRKHRLTDNPYWTANLEHTTYDAFWQARSVWRHFRDVTPAVLTVGGWYDAENLSGALRTYTAVRDQSPATRNHLVMGPWTHGGWARGNGAAVGRLAFGEPTAVYFRERLELPFFMSALKGAGAAALPEATVFDTGAHQWRTFERWPPRGLRERTVFLASDGRLALEAPASEGHASYTSDPAQPVPLVGHEAQGMPRDYMAEDQRFSAGRPDVLVYASAPLDEDITLLGEIDVELHVATSATDADFVVKLIDVHPDGSATAEGRPSAGARPDGFQQLVRGEPFRGKFREGFETPVPFEPGVPVRLGFSLGHAAHTFRRGHRIMVHVQSSWFPLVDRNPQTFTHIPDARPEQFVKATQRIYHGGTRASRITFTVER